MAVTGAARMARRSGVLAWALWVLVVLGLAAGFWLEVCCGGPVGPTLWRPRLARRWQR